MNKLAEAEKCTFLDFNQLEHGVTEGVSLDLQDVGEEI